jgi:hypothetical protein
MLGGNAVTIESELVALTDDEGFIKPRTVVEWARNNPDSEVYKHLEWDDVKAAEAHRIDQARRLIVIHVRSEEGERATISLVQDRNSNGGYRHMGAVMSNAQLRLMALRQALRELRRFEQRYRHLQELGRIFEEAARVEAEATAADTTAAA